MSLSSIEIKFEGTAVVSSPMIARRSNKLWKKHANAIREAMLKTGRFLTIIGGGPSLVTRGVMQCNNDPGRNDLWWISWTCRDHHLRSRGFVEALEFFVFIALLHLPCGYLVDSQLSKRMQRQKNAITKGLARGTIERCPGDKWSGPVVYRCRDSL